MNVRYLLPILACMALAVGIAMNWHAVEPAAVAPRISFNRDIRPILNQNCTSCHGGVRQKNGVSFIYREEALGKGKSGRPTVVPGHPEQSELIARVTSTDPEGRMPYHAPPLSAAQIALLRQWIKEGAQWEEHWAFVAPKPQALPAVKNTAWPRQPLDRFILARLDKEGLTPAPQADRPALLRRVSLDLTGLPPTPQELAAFLADSSADAYEKQVDRLLASPRYGERWATVWLDLARYADTRGNPVDRNRTTWPYRDWVIDAFNRNLPYDRFVITQLAGDLLPNATFEDLIATSFQRQTPVNDETGTDNEEFRVVAVMDRVATTWSVLNGLTMNCVQCHSHPYDPIRHKEYYQFLAFYNTSRDADLADDSPNLPIPQDFRRSEMAQLVQRKDQLLREIVEQGRFLAERTPWTLLPITTAAADEALGWERFFAKLKQVQPPSNMASPQEREYYTEFYRQDLDLVHTALAFNHARHAVPLKIDHGEEWTPESNLSEAVFTLTSEPAASLVTALRIEIPPVNPDKARHTPEDAFFVDRIDAWLLVPGKSPEQIKFRYFAPDSQEDLLRAVESRAPPSGGFAATDKLFRTRWMIAIPEKPLTLAAGSRLKIELTHTKGIAANVLAASQPRLDAGRDKHWAALASDQLLIVRSAEIIELFGYKPTVAKRVRLTTSADERWSALAGDPALQKKLAELTDTERRLEQIPTVPLPVMVEEPADQRRQTLEFERGNFLTKVGLPLSPDVPKLFPKLPDHAPRNRLTMAKWFFSPDQPLTARVAVNRYWEQLFGTGIVETLEDFGSVGQPPSHPELLDWLALHFQNDLRWDMKALVRELVTSATYRQGAATTPALLEKDPRNRLLARGPQQRLTAEMVRDQAMLASGLLNTAMGGPPVMPPQPAGAGAIVAAKWINTHGPNQHRRAIYTYMKRHFYYPSFLTFDAGSHEVSVARRTPTNTPLQALVTLNDPVYHEAAQALARRMLALDVSTVSASVSRQPPSADQALQARLNYGAECVWSRDPSAEQRAWLETLYTDARKLSPRDPDLAAFTAVAGVLLNVDAAFTR